MLTLDDYGMLLLDKTRDAYDDLRTAEIAKSQVMMGELIADRFYYLSSSLRERDNAFFDLAIEFAGHVWMLEAYPPNLHIHRLPHHITLSENTITLFDQLRDYVQGDAPGSLATAYLKDTVIPAVFEEAKRQDEDDSAAR